MHRAWQDFKNVVYINTSYKKIVSERRFLLRRFFYVQNEKQKRQARGKMKAVMDRVFIKLDDEENIRGGILMPESSYENRTIGRVLAVGPEVKAVKVGDRVMFHAFDELPTLKKDVVVVRQNSLLAILEE